MTFGKHWRRRKREGRENLLILCLLVRRQVPAVEVHHLAGEQKAA